MNEKQLHALAAEFAKNLKTPENLNQFSRIFKKITVEAALNGELTDHLGYEKHQPRKGKNARNGYTSKTVICDEGEIEIETPRDRDCTFEPQLILVRNSLKFVSRKDYKAVTADLKQVYQAPTEAQARENLTALSQKW